jgi:hypothetical protein
MNRAKYLLLPVALMLALLAACSGGAPTQLNPVTTAPQVADYTGPAPSNADVQAFKINLWENIKASNRCGGCHNATMQSPHFARNDDVNLAYQDANTVVNLTQPDQSRMVLKVGGGHNCWLASNSACADILTTWIRNWAGSVAGGGTQIQLTAPADITVGSSKAFPADSTAFASTIYPVTRQYCSRCHSSGAAVPQSPFHADTDVNVAYAAAQPKINLDNPAQSRLVARLRDEFHNCWSDCAANAQTMLNAVNAFVGPLPIQQVDPSLVVSKALGLYDGTIASGANRYDTDTIALYQFKTGTGNVAYDTSGVDPAANLTLSGNVTWVGGWGLNFAAGSQAQASTATSKKLSDQIRSTGEYSIEVWAAPANVAQENAFVVSYSGGTTARNVTLAQRAYQYEAMNRSSTTDGNGAPSLLSSATARFAQASLQHVVLTYDPVNGRKLYVNGVFTGDVDPVKGGTLDSWDDTFALVLGNETSGNRQWLGVTRLLAIHNRAMSLAQIQQNFAAGVGERYFLLFNVSSIVNVPQSYVMLTTSQLDNYAYQFTTPTFISLDPTAAPDNIPVKGMRIGINGAEATVGQAYVPLNTTISAAHYKAGVGQLLSRIGTVIALAKGPAADQFFLTFEQLGSATHVVVDASVPPPAPPPDAPPSPDVGVRVFDSLNASMSQITGIPTTNAGVSATYQTVIQQLPSIPDIGAFLASNQTGVAQLAIKYCAALVDDPTKSAAFFPGLNFSQPAGVYFSSQANMNLVINPLLQKAIGTGLASQPSSADMTTALSNLIGKLIAGPTGTAAGGTATVTKAACAAVLGSGALTIE